MDEFLERRWIIECNRELSIEDEEELKMFLKNKLAKNKKKFRLVTAFNMGFSEWLE